MAEYSRFFDHIDGDRTYNADDFAEYFRQVLTSGILNGGENLQVYVSGTDRIARIKPGKAWLEGYFYKLTEELELPLDEAHGTYDRIDRIVIRLNTNAESRNIKAYVKTGEPSSTPEVPVITREGDIYELSLAQILVLHNTTAIPVGNVTDERLDNEACGLANIALTYEEFALKQDTGDINDETLPAELKGKPLVEQIMYVLQHAGKVKSVNGKTGEVILSASDVGAVPTSRRVNNKVLTSNITIDVPDIAGLVGPKLALGYGTSAVNFSVALGQGASAAGDYAVALGQGASAAKDYAVALGKDASAAEICAVALGQDASAGSYSVALGQNASAGSYSVALGLDASGANYAVALGWGASAENASAALGQDASAGEFAVAIGRSALAEDYSVALGQDAEAGTYAVALGGVASAGTYAVALGRAALAGDSAVALGRNTSAVKYAVALGRNTSAMNANEGILGGTASDVTSKWIVPGSFTVNGTKNFEIPHPKPEKSATHVIRHGAVESPTQGDTLYRYKITATKENDLVTIDLPDYFIWLNKDVQIWVTGQGHFGNGYGTLNRETEQLEIHCQYEGEYNVLVIGTRNDDHQSVQDWDIKGVEREIGESWTGETYAFSVDEILEVEEIKEVS